MAVEASTCIINGIEPLQLQITNNQVSTSSAAMSRGIAFSIGDSNQLFSGMPALGDNSTYLPHVISCGDTSNASCVASHGVTSTTDPKQWNGTLGWGIEQGDGDGYNELFFNDRLKIAGHEIPGFPFYTSTDAETGDTGWSSLSLGTNSSFLSAALDVNIIGTKQWSLWPGNLYDNLDGLLILGGYDEDRIAGEFTTFEVDPQENYIYVQIRGLDWEDADGIVTDLMPNRTEYIWATIEPFFDWVAMQTESMDKFVAATNYTTFNYTAEMYQWNDLPVGNLIVTLNNDMKTTIPAQDLFGHPQHYTDEGSFEVLNTSYYQAKVWQYDNVLLRLGQPFLTQKVLITDWDQGVFHLADAVKEDLGQGATNVKPLCTASVPPPPVETDPPRDDGPNVAAIAGGVAGGVGGLLLIGLIVFFVLRRRKKQKAQQQQQQQQQQTPYLSEVSEPPFRGSTTSPPPKYMGAGVHETTASPDPSEPKQSPGPWQTHSPPVEMDSPNQQAQGHLSPLGSPTRSDAGSSTSPWGDASSNTMPVSDIGTTRYGMSSDRRFNSISGPLEMPADYNER